MKKKRRIGEDGWEESFRLATPNEKRVYTPSLWLRDVDYGFSSWLPKPRCKEKVQISREKIFLYRIKCDKRAENKDLNQTNTVKRERQKGQIMVVPSLGPAHRLWVFEVTVLVRRWISLLLLYPSLLCSLRQSRSVYLTGISPPQVKISSPSERSNSKLSKKRHNTCHVHKTIGLQLKQIIIFTTIL